jgi:hypothetical protein
MSNKVFSFLIIFLVVVVVLLSTGALLLLLTLLGAFDMLFLTLPPVGG